MFGTRLAEFEVIDRESKLGSDPVTDERSVTHIL
jgi:hypothetical protein